LHSYRGKIGLQKAKQAEKDIWDKISALTPPLTTLVLGVLGAYVTYTVNAADLREKRAQADAEQRQRVREADGARLISQAQNLEALFPYISSSDPQKRELGYQMYAALGQGPLAVRVIALRKDPAGARLFEQLSEKPATPNNQKVLSTSMNFDARILEDYERILAFDRRANISRQDTRSLLGSGVPTLRLNGLQSEEPPAAISVTNLTTP